MLSNSVRNALLLLLTVTSGCVDAISFLALGQVFTAAMTGNTVLFGLALVHTGGLNAVSYLVALVGFILGVAAGSLILIRQKGNGWSPRINLTIGFELVALIMFGILVSVWTDAPCAWQQAVLIVLLAFAMGAQGVSARIVGVTGVTTTVITSTLTGLVESVVRKATASSSSNSLEAEHKAKIPAPIYFFMWISAIVCYGIGAALCGLAVTHFHFEAVWLPVVIVFIVLVTGALLQTRAAAGQRG